MPEKAEVRALPEGFTLKSCSTQAAGHSYTVECPQADSLKAIRDAYKAAGKNYEEIVLAIWNAGNEQGAKQGQKDPVRKAVDAGKGVEEAVGKHQKAAKGFIQGAPRGGGGARHVSGYTKAQREALGTAMALEMATTGAMPSEARMGEIATELGLDPANLATTA